MRGVANGAGSSRPAAESFSFGLQRRPRGTASSSTLAEPMPRTVKSDWLASFAELSAETFYSACRAISMAISFRLFGQLSKVTLFAPAICGFVMPSSREAAG